MMFIFHSVFMTILCSVFEASKLETYCLVSNEDLWFLHSFLPLQQVFKVFYFCLHVMWQCTSFSASTVERLSIAKHVTLPSVRCEKHYKCNKCKENAFSY